MLRSRAMISSIVSVMPGSPTHGVPTWFVCAFSKCPVVSSARRSGITLINCIRGPVEPKCDTTSLPTISKECQESGTLLPNQMRRDNARMGRTSVLPNVEPLPGAQCQAAASNGNREVHGSKGGTHVSGHVILALSSMHEQWIAITHETGKKTFQIAAHV